jgi:DNA modification methylase
MINECYVGDVRDGLRAMIAAGVRAQTCVTSPPYWGLRDYGTAKWDGGDGECSHLQPATGSTQNKGNNGRNGTPFGELCGLCGATRVDRQIGLESTIGEYVETMVDVFRLVRDVLADDGTLWLNLGDSYSASPAGNRVPSGMSQIGGKRGETPLSAYNTQPKEFGPLKPKDICGIPWRVAFALQADGWWLRQDIIWAKPNPMPESVTDRCTKSHEYLFLLAKRERYYYDAAAIAEEGSGRVPGNVIPQKIDSSRNDGGIAGIYAAQQREQLTRNRRSVWTIATESYADAHFATFPTALVEPCIMAGTSERGHCPACGKGWERVIERVGGPPRGDHRANHDVDNCKTAHATGTVAGSALSSIYAKYGYAENRTTGWQPTCSCGLDPVPAVVLDPFMGSGTVAQVAQSLGRRWAGCELNPEYVAMQRKRAAQLGLAF